MVLWWGWERFSIVLVQPQAQVQGLWQGLSQHPCSLLSQQQLTSALCWCGTFNLKGLLAPSSGPEQFCLYLSQKQSIFAHGLVLSGLPTSPPEAGKYCFCSSPESLLGLWQQEQSRSSPIISLRAFALNWKKAPGKSTVSFPDPRSTQLTPVPSVKLLYSLLPVEESLGMRAHSPCVQGSWLTGPYSACGNVSILADLLLHACMTAMFSSCSATAETVYVISLLKGTSPSWNSVHGRFAMQFSDRLRKSMVV